MNITDRQLTCDIDLTPRAVVLSGFIKPRTKRSEAGEISAFTPHYAIKGCPVGMFGPDGELTSIIGESLCIECDFAEESTVGLGMALSSYSGRSQNMVHLAFGRSGSGPNGAEAKALKEAGELLRSMTGEPGFLVALPILTSGQYGVALGRYYALGLFRSSGEPVWVHPGAQQAGLLSCPLPKHQRQRSLEPGPVFQTPEPDQFAEIHNRLAVATGKSGLQLHNQVIAAYTSQLIISGKASTQAEATNMARDAYERFKQAQERPRSSPAPVSSPSQTPAKPATATEAGNTAPPGRSANAAKPELKPMPKISRAKTR